jgi:hypothetical protein
LAAVPTAEYSIGDASATLAAALTTGSASLETVQAATLVDVTGVASLEVNADQFGNLLASPTVLAADDTIVINGAETANLGTLDFFGSDVNTGMTLGGALNGSYTVDMGTSGMRTVVMEGLGLHDITAATDLAELFTMGLDSLGGHTLRGLEAGTRADRINVNGGGSVNLDPTAVATGTDVDVSGEWAFDASAGGGTLTWFDETHLTADTLILQFGAGATGIEIRNNHEFDVV